MLFLGKLVERGNKAHKVILFYQVWGLKLGQQIEPRG